VNKVKQNLRGVLPGLAVGDALGATLEFQRAAEIALAYPDGFREIVGGGVFHWRAGDPTDDTDLALVLARSLARRKRLDPSDVAAGMVEWFRGGPRDIGGTCAAAISLLARGYPPAISGKTVWQQSNRPVEHRPAGNGSLMYAAPLALHHAFSTTEQRRHDATRLSHLTHYDPRCQAALRVYLRGIPLLAEGSPRALDIPLQSLAKSEPDTAAVLQQYRNTPPERLNVDGPGIGFVLTTLGIALSAVQHATSFEDGLVRVVMRGGDADTNGAVAGALLGARFGRTGIPSRWLKVTQAVSEMDALSRQILGL
jgi:ADP-ribosyl-[dinitrogen reductase] hydrolase